RVATGGSPSSPTSGCRIGIARGHAGVPGDVTVLGRLVDVRADEGRAAPLAHLVAVSELVVATVRVADLGGVAGAARGAPDAAVDGSAVRAETGHCERGECESLHHVPLGAAARSWRETSSR